MLKIHPQVIKSNGKKQFVVLPYDEFAAVQERLEDAEDVLELRRVKREEAGKPSIALADVKARLRLARRRRKG